MLFKTREKNMFKGRKEKMKLWRKKTKKRHMEEFPLSAKLTRMEPYTHKWLGVLFFYVV